MRNADLPIVGRETELAAIESFLAETAAGPGVLLLEGDAGIGKTTLWEAALVEAERRPWLVLSYRASEAEAGLPLAGLGDILEQALPEALAQLPEPQARALAVAMYREESRQPLDPRALRVATLGAFRAVAQRMPVLVAVDDLQWLDSSSADVLEFVLRRLRAEPIGLIATWLKNRPNEPPLRLGRLPTLAVRRLEIGPLSLGALRRVIGHRTGRALPRPLFARIQETSGGNPFFALELVRALERRNVSPLPGWPLPVPEAVDRLVQERLADLPPETVQVLLIAAASAAPTVGLVAAAVGGDPTVALRSAIQSQVLEAEDGRLRFTHPLLASAVYGQADPGVLRDLHLKLAELTATTEERARHLALGSDTPNSAVAAELQAAAADALRRGAPAACAELLEHAIRLTPPNDQSARVARTLDAADAHFEAGDTASAAGLLGPLADSLPPGAARADVLRRIAHLRYHTDTVSSAVELLQQALEEAGDDRALRCRVLRGLARTVSILGQTRASQRYAEQALALAEEIDDQAGIAESIAQVCMTTTVLGGAVDTDLLERGIAAERHSRRMPEGLRPSVYLLYFRLWADDLEGARAAGESALASASARGDEWIRPHILSVLAQVEILAGDWTRGLALAMEAVETSDQAGEEITHCQALAVRAHLEALAGNAAAVREDAHEALAIGQRRGGLVMSVQPLAALGFLELSLGNPGAAHEHLGSLGEAVAAIGLGHPSAVRWLPDEIEALVELGRLDKAGVLVDAFQTRARQLPRPWALAAAARCRALLLSARGDLDAALDAASEAVALHGSDMPFERARTLLVKGRISRRAKRKRDAREALLTALDMFEQLPAPMWADKARAELDRIGGRPGTDGRLTAAEEQVATLVAAGHRNSEVASTLHLTVRTVETHLSSIYRKEGVRSRVELARLMSRPDRA